MILSKSGQKTNSNHYVVALDIGTEFVKALIAEAKGDHLEIIGVGRAHQALSDMQSGAIADIAGVVSNCDAALTAAERSAQVDAREAIIGIAGELVKGTTSTIRFKRAHSENPLTIEEMERIVERVQDRASQQAQRMLALEVGNKDIDVRLVNSALVGIEIDGYKVTNPVGFQGRDVGVQLYTAFAPMIHIGALERTAEELDLTLLAVAAEPFAVARSMLGSDATSSFSAILIDVGGGTTDIAVVNDGGVEGTKMFGIGGRAFTRAIANEMDLDFEAAEALKLELSEGTLDEKRAVQVEGALEKTLKVWLTGIELALSEFEGLDHLPNRVLLCGGGASLSLLVEALQSRGWYDDLPFTKQPTIQHITPKQVAGIVDKTGTINDHTYITAMGLLRVGLDTIEPAEATARTSLKERLNRLLSI